MKANGCWRMLAIAFTIALTFSPLYAQDAHDAVSESAGPPKFLNMIHEELKPGRNLAYQELRAAIARVYSRENIPVYWIEFESLTGPPEALSVNLFRSSEEMAQSMNASNAGLAAQPELAQMQDRLLQENTLSGTTVLGVRRDDMGYRANTMDLSKMRFLRLSTVFAHPGYERAFMETEWSLSEASEKANARTPWAVYEVLGGLPQPAYVIITPMQSLNEIDDVFETSQTLRKTQGGALEQHLQELARIAYGTIDSRIFVVGQRASHVSKELAAGDPNFWTPAAIPATPANSGKTDKPGSRTNGASAAPKP